MEADEGKRKLVKALAGAGVVGAGLKTGVIPATWVKPVIDSVVPAAHAQTSIAPSSSPAASVSVAPRPVPVASGGLIAFAAAALGFLGFKRLASSKADRNN